MSFWDASLKSTIGGRCHGTANSVIGSAPGTSRGLSVGITLTSPIFIIGASTEAHSSWCWVPSHRKLWKPGLIHLVWAVGAGSASLLEVANQSGSWWFTARSDRPASTRYRFICSIPDSSSDYTCLRRALLRDLETEINTCLLAGEKLVIAGDFNELTTGGNLYNFFSKFGFREATFSRSPYDTKERPATMSRGRIPGRRGLAVPGGYPMHWLQRGCLSPTVRGTIELR